MKIQVHCPFLSRKEEEWISGWDWGGNYGKDIQ